MSPDDPHALLGVWDLSREIVEQPGDERSRVDGTTTLAADGDSIDWYETGTLSRRGLRTPVSRRLRIEPREDGWFVTFEDGRDFHPWRPGEPVEHPCGADRYVGTIRRLDTDHWTVQWRVTGPRKDYVMTSVLTRSAARPEHRRGAP